MDDFNVNDLVPGKIHKGAVKVSLTPPGIILCNPKYPHNVGAAVRAAANFCIESVVWTGGRIPFEGNKGYRLPREERMRDYQDVFMINYERPFDLFRDFTPVAVEVRDNSERLPNFVHPENAVYVFGPEDGSIDKGILTLCHKFVIIPTISCLNLGAAVNVILYDRLAKGL